MKLYLLAVAAIAATNVAAFPQQYTDPNQSATQVCIDYAVIACNMYAVYIYSMMAVVINFFANQVDAGLTGGDGYANTGGQVNLHNEF